MRRFTPAAFIPAFIAILAAHSTTVNAQSDPVMDYCSTVGCSTVVSLLNPCGGGASNSSLQQDLTFTVTPDLGSCECNSRFFNALSECLGCISSQNKNHPVIDTQINWTNNCKAYGFNMTDAPIPYTPPTSGGSSQGLGAGAIAGIVVGILVLLGAGGFFFLKTGGAGARTVSLNDPTLPPMHLDPMSLPITRLDSTLTAITSMTSIPTTTTTNKEDTRITIRTTTMAPDRTATTRWQ